MEALPAHPITFDLDIMYSFSVSVFDDSVDLVFEPLWHSLAPRTLVFSRGRNGNGLSGWLVLFLVGEAGLVVEL